MEDFTLSILQFRFWCQCQLNFFRLFASYFLIPLSFRTLFVFEIWWAILTVFEVWIIFKFVVVVNQTVRCTLQYTWMISITFWFNSDRLVDVSLVEKCPKKFQINMKECVKLFMNIWYISETCWFSWKIKKTDREEERVRMAIILKAN